MKVKLGASFLLFITASLFYVPDGIGQNTMEAETMLLFSPLPALSMPPVKHHPGKIKQVYNELPELIENGTDAHIESVLGISTLEESTYHSLTEDAYIYYLFSWKDVVSGDASLETY